MALRIALIALLAAALAQNLAEAMAGGPAIPSLMPDLQRPIPAVLLVCLLVVGLILPAAGYLTPLTLALAAMAADAPALNAALQGGASLLSGSRLPGTLPGLALILPAALSLLALIGRPALRPATLGAILSPFALLGLWHVAALLP